VKTVNDKVVRYSLAYLSVQKNDWWETSLLRENLAETGPPFAKRRLSVDFRWYRRSHKRHSLAKKSSIITNKIYPVRAFQWA